MIFKNLMLAAGVVGTLGVAAPAFADTYVPIAAPIAVAAPVPVAVPAPVEVAWGYGRGYGRVGYGRGYGWGRGSFHRYEGGRAWHGGWGRSYHRGRW
ncbi:MAG TPA: hypothetical protein VIA18_02370 [Polyangia bacterium]|jgi:hypothetical protein|nr:hypothetical protein [Polyangia bacterium]